MIDKKNDIIIITEHLFDKSYDGFLQEKFQNLKMDIVPRAYLLHLPLHEKDHPRRQNNDRIMRERLQDLQRTQHR